MVQECTATGHHAGIGLQATGHLHAAATLATGLHLELADFLVGPHGVHITETIAHHHRRLRHGERLALAQFNFTLCIHACACAAGLQGQVHIHQGVAGLRIDRGRNHAHLALQQLAAGGLDVHRRTHLNAANLGGRHFSAPLDAALANQAKQLGACAHHAAHRGLPRRDHTCVWGAHLGLRQAHRLQLHHGAGRLHTRLRRRIGGQGLTQLGVAEKALLLQAAGTV